MIEKSYIVFGSGLAALALLLNSCGAVKEKNPTPVLAKDSPMVRFRAGSINAQHAEINWIDHSANHPQDNCKHCWDSNNDSSTQPYSVITLSRFGGTSSPKSIKVSPPWGVWINGGEKIGVLVCSNPMFNANRDPVCDLDAGGATSTNLTVMPFPQSEAEWKPQLSSDNDPDDKPYVDKKRLVLCKTCDHPTIQRVTIMQHGIPDQVYVCSAESDGKRHCRVRIHSIDN